MAPPSITDALDVTQGFLDYILGQEGPAGFGSASTAAEVAEHYTNQIRGRVFMVTGCTSGMGRETAFRLAEHGGIVVLASRSKAKLEDTQAQIHRCYPEAVTHVVQLDTSSLRSVGMAIADFTRLDLPGLNALICNAGIAFTSYSTAPEMHNVESQFATNYLGHYALCLGLLPELLRAASVAAGVGGKGGTGGKGGGGGTKSRIVLVSSMLHKVAYVPSGIRLDDLSGQTYYNPIAAYGQSKLAMLLFMEQLNKRLQERQLPVTVNALHPGPVNSSITRHFMAWAVSNPSYVLFTKLVGKTVPQGAATHVFLAVAPEVKDVSGKYFIDCRPEQYWHVALDKDPKLGEKLWQASARITNYDL